jgi:hypothetical protein
MVELVQFFHPSHHPVLGSLSQVSLKVGHSNALWKAMECSKDFCTAEHAYQLKKKC